MAAINQSINEGVCIDEEIFFGPVTDKERRIREHFENAYKGENKITGELPKIDENDISRNDSLFVSFSVDDSKYDSFDDSLNEDLDKKPQGTKQVPLRKSFDKLKPKKHGFYDSLEDVCSLASNIEKCSISCEVENEKQHIIEDSLRNPPAAVANKSCGVSEQIHFDDDSLAIAEFENTFDDSLEEFNVLSSVEIEEINDVEILAMENHNVLSKVEQNPVCASRNLFETSVPVIYEKNKETDLADHEESSGDKNMLYDSLSNSDFKDILRDSLEDSENCIDKLLKHVSDASVVNTQKLEQFSTFPSIKVDEIKDEKCTTTGFKIDENLNCTSRSLFDTSVQIICEKRQETVSVDQELSDDKNMLYDSLSNSDFKDILKDSLEESDEGIVNLIPGSDAPTTDTEKLEQTSVKPCILDNSVQIVYENLQSLHSEENISGDITNSIFNIPKHSLGNLKNKRDFSDQRTDKTSFEDNSLFFGVDVAKNALVDGHNAIYLDSNANQNGKGSEDRLHPVLSKPDFFVSAVETSNLSKETLTVDSSNQNGKGGEDRLQPVLSEPDFPISAVEAPNLSKETLTIDSCHLKLLNDNLNVDKDLKFQLHIEVTVGDKKCKIAAEDIKLLPVTNLNSKINESNPLMSVPAESENCVIKERIDVLDSHSSNSCRKNKVHSISDENILFTDSNENNSCQEHKTINEANVTKRVKASVSQQFNNSDLKFNSYEDVNDENLLQALDLHDLSTSFLNESVIQSNDSLIPLNLCSREQDIKKIQVSLFRNESKENFPESAVHSCKEKDICSPLGKKNQSKLNYRKTPKSLQKSPSFKETTKKIPGTKIPVRKVENFVVPAIASKVTSGALSAEKIRKHHHPQTPLSTEKKTPITTPNKTHHFCKVRNTIFSKVPQIVPSKKYINIQSPVAQYIRNTPGSAKTPILDPVLRDCMNHMHQQLESPYHLYQTTKSGSAKSTKRKV